MPYLHTKSNNLEKLGKLLLLMLTKCAIHRLSHTIVLASLPTIKDIAEGTKSIRSVHTKGSISARRAFAASPGVTCDIVACYVFLTGFRQGMRIAETAF